MIPKKNCFYENKPEILQEDLTIPLTIDKTKKQLKKELLQPVKKEKKKKEPTKSKNNNNKPKPKIKTKRRKLKIIKGKNTVEPNQEVKESTITADNIDKKEKEK